MVVPLKVSFRRNFRYPVEAVVEFLFAFEYLYLALLSPEHLYFRALIKRDGLFVESRNF